MKLMQKLVIPPDVPSSSQPADLLSKIVDAILSSGPIKTMSNIAEFIQDETVLRTVAHSRAVLCFICFAVTQHDDYTFNIDRDDNLDALGGLHLSCLLRKNESGQLNGWHSLL